MKSQQAFLKTISLQLISIVLTLTFANISTAGEDKRLVNVIMEINPLSIINSPDIDGFFVSGSSSGSSFFYFESIDGSTSLAPNFKLGVNFDTSIVNINLLAGGGRIINDVFRGNFVTYESAFMFKLVGNNVTLGPHIGIINLADADWKSDYSGQASIDLLGNTGTFGGLVFTAGGQMISFKANIDFINAEYDVVNLDTINQIVSDNTLDLSGLWINIGVHFRF